MKNVHGKMLRRTFLRGVAVFTVNFSLANFLISCSDKGNTEVAVVSGKKTIKLGEEIDESLVKFSIHWTPDVHLSYITLPKENIRRFFITGNGGLTYLLEGNASDDLLKLVKRTPKTSLSVVWGPDKFSNSRYAYSAICSILQIDEKNLLHLIGFTHNEQHAGTNASGTFTASISQLESLDGGTTWKQVGTAPIIKGDDPMRPGCDVSGAGQPCAIVRDGYVYIYYIDWARKHAHHPDQIYLTRGRIEVDGSVRSYEFYKGNQRFAPGETDLVPVIPILDNKSGSYVALPSISYNTALNRLLGVIELNGAFGITTSENGVQWNTPQLLMTFTPHSQLKSGDTFISYPTLISPKEASDNITDTTGYLIYAKGSPHNMVMRQFTIS